MKRVCCFILVLALGFLCASCAYPPSEQYDDFLADLDLIMRFELCFDRVENGTVDFYTEGELPALQKDVASCTIDDLGVQKANGFLTETAQQLADSIRYGREGEEKMAAGALEDAKKSYKNAKDQIGAIRADTANG